MDEGLGLGGTGYSDGDLDELLEELSVDLEEPPESPMTGRSGTENECPKCGYEW